MDDNLAAETWRKTYGAKIRVPEKQGALSRAIGRLADRLWIVGPFVKRMVGSKMVEEWTKDTEFWASSVQEAWAGIDRTMPAQFKPRAVKAFCRFIHSRVAKTRQYSNAIIATRFVPKWTNEFQAEFERFISAKRGRRPAQEKKIDARKTVYAKNIEIGMVIGKQWEVLDAETDGKHVFVMCHAPSGTKRAFKIPAGRRVNVQEA